MNKPVGMKPLEYYIESYRRYKIRLLALKIKNLIDEELGTATARTLQKVLKEKYNREHSLDEIDEAIKLIVDTFRDEYEAYRRNGHLGIRRLPNPEYQLPPEAKKLVEELLTP